MSQGRLTAATFPILPPNEIVETCRSLNPPCDVTEEDLHKPTVSRVQQIYEWWMARILGLNTEDCLRAANRELDQMDHSDIYRDAMYVGVFEEALSQLFDMAAIDDFTTKDLTAPTSIRFRQHLSGLINFYLFEQEQAAETLDPVIAEEEDLLNKEETLLARSEELQRLIAESTKQRAENAPKVTDAKQAIEQTKLDIKAIRDKCLALTEKYETYKAETSSLRQQLVELRQTNRNYALEVSRLRTQIVQSPDRLRGSIEKMTSENEKEQEQLKQLEAKERHASAKLASLTKYESDLGACVKIMDEWEAEVERVKEGEARLRSQTEMLESLEAEKEDLKERIELLKRRLQSSNQQIARFEERLREKRKMKREAKSALELQHAELLDNKRKLENEAAQKNKEAADVEASIRQILADTHAELDKGKAAYAKIRDQILMYSLKLNKALDLINEVSTEPVDFAS